MSPDDKTDIKKKLCLKDETENGKTCASIVRLRPENLRLNDKTGQDVDKRLHLNHSLIPATPPLH